MSNNQPTLKEIHEILIELNELVPEQLVDLGFKGFTLNTDGFWATIEFAGVVIWHMDDDRRDYVGDTEDYEDLTCYLSREATSLSLKLQRYTSKQYIDLFQ